MDKLFEKKKVRSGSAMRKGWKQKVARVVRNGYKSAVKVKTEIVIMFLVVVFFLMYFKLLALESLLVRTREENQTLH